MKGAPENLPGMVGRDRAMLEVYRIVRRAATGDLPVLIVGETGTGKELVAQALHTLSERRKGPFIDVNCAAIPESLAEGELFGWERGAFTGAVTQTTGLLESADGGTLFLDEACSLPVGMQAKLLRAIEQGGFRRVGGRRRRQAAFRLVSAVAEAPEVLVPSGRLRADFAYRIAAITISIPPLRARPEDIRLLVHHFLRQQLPGGGQSRSLDPQALALLQHHTWPGNVRELRTLLERLTLLVDEPVLTAAHILAHQPALLDTLDESRRLRAALDACGGDVSKAARSMGISRAQFYRKLNQHRQRSDSVPLAVSP